MPCIGGVSWDLCISARVFLRQPTQYASEVASFGHSVQLWTSGLVVTIGVTASTSSSANVALTTHSGHRTTLWSWWVPHQLVANTGQQSGSDWVAVPAGLSSGGASFQTFFVPQSAQSSPRQSRPDLTISPAQATT